MYYVHFDSHGRPNMWTGFKSRSEKRAIEYCDTLSSKAYVSREINGISPFDGKPSKVFEKPIYCNRS